MARLGAAGFLVGAGYVAGCATAPVTNVRVAAAALGLACRADRWETVKCGRVVPMQNAVCELPGAPPERIVLVAHLDQSPRTAKGAGNDASGIGVLLHLAEVFAAEPTPAYGLSFVASDGEGFGMLGTRRYPAVHPDAARLVAGISLDNVGKWVCRGVDLDPRGRFRGYGPLWFQCLVRDVAVGESPAPRVYGVVDQVLGQAVPISFMDEGPMVAAGIAAVGPSGTEQAEFGELHDATYHDPGDTLGRVRARALGGAAARGRRRGTLGALVMGAALLAVALAAGLALVVRPASPRVGFSPAASGSGRWDSATAPGGSRA